MQTSTCDNNTQDSVQKSIQNNIRKDIINMLCQAGSGHSGGSLSAADILASLYFGGVFKHDPQNPHLQNRDRFILSKGHAAPALYATLAQAGYIPKTELNTLRKFGSNLQGHPDWFKVAGVEVSTGSLGQGLSISAGLSIALAQQFAGQKRIPQVVTLLGDGELQEGQVWEAAMFAAHQNCGNLTAIVDANGLQIDGATQDVAGLVCFGGQSDISAKFKAFGWQTLDIDGHNGSEIEAALKTAFKPRQQPFVIVAKTIKGKAISFMENNCDWHGVAPSIQERDAALAELGS